VIRNPFPGVPGGVGPLCAGVGPLYGVEVGKTRTRWPVRTYSRLVPGASGRVLVVDDNKVIRQLIRVNLELEGLEVVTAADGAECLDVVHQVRPDVVTLDVVMPRLDGLRTAARLRADPRTHHLPLAIISACTQYEVDTGLDVGVDAFLAKPFEPAELVRLVKQLIERGGGDGAGGDGGGGEGHGGEGGHRGGGEGDGGGDEDGEGGQGGVGGGQRVPGGISSGG
jgi:CheY-like chemotaxis protein